MMTDNHARTRPGSPVTIIGLGPMGQAMAHTLLRSGHPVTLWNRTRSRAESLVAEGAVLAADPADAVGASQVTILSLTDYQAMYDVLEGSTDALAGRTLVNLSSESPAGTREAAQWARAHGAELVVGGIMVPALMVGTEASTIFYSGPEPAFAEALGVLAPLGETQYLGEDPALAQLMYQANLSVFLTSLSSLAHATALLTGAGLPAAQVMPGLLEMIRTTPDLVTAGGDPTLWQMVESGEHPGDLSTAMMMGATADHIVEATKEAGVDLTLPRAVQGHYRQVIDAGYGRDNWSRIIDAIRGELG